MIHYLIALVLLAISPCTSAHEQRHELKTYCNAYGIKEDETCIAVHHDGTITVICSGGKKIEHVTTIEGSPTGTPPWLEYENYIGYRIEREPTKGRVGSGTRIVYCKGMCKKK